MLQALLAGVASIRAQQTKMDAIGNNLANVNTTAFKGSRVTFQDMISQTYKGASKPQSNAGGTNPIQIGLGVRIAGTDTDTAQGSLQATNRASDLAIQGNGFFMLSNSERVAYSRDGGFDLDANGMLVQRATGERLVGWTANGNGDIDTNVPVTPKSFLTVPVGSLDASQVTSEASLKGNLNAESASGETWSATIRVFDSLGGGHDVTVTFGDRTVPAAGTAPTGAASSWEWSAAEGSTSAGDFSTGSNQRLYFDSNGKLLNGDVLGSITVPSSGSSAAFPMTLDFSRLGQLKGDNTVTPYSQNGFPPGSLDSYSIGPDGKITGLFTNGLTRYLGQVAMAVVSNPGGMERIGSNLWRDNDNSGIPIVGVPRAGGRGQINAGFLEQSNIDISNEFTDLIVTQRGFQANTKIVTTVDEMLQDVINMKR